jgi:hypothetical protein
MSYIKILTKTEVEAFDSPPHFTYEERRKYFRISAKLKNQILQLRKPVSVVGFVLQYGYFRYAHRFFAYTQFQPKDIEFIMREFGYKPSSVVMETYKGMLPDHQAIILHLCGYTSFKQGQPSFEAEIKHLVSNRLHPRQIFQHMLSLLTFKRVEIPSYHTFLTTITDQLNEFEKGLVTFLGNVLTGADKALLDHFLETDSSGGASTGEAPAGKPIRLHAFKKISQSTRPGRIKESLFHFLEVKELYTILTPIVESMNLTAPVINYYATWASKARNAQLTQLTNPHNRYLHVICFYLPSILHAAGFVYRYCSTLRATGYKCSRKRTAGEIFFFPQKAKSGDSKPAPIQAVL